MEVYPLELARNLSVGRGQGWRESCSQSVAGFCALQEPGPGEAVASRDTLLATELPERECWGEGEAAGLHCKSLMLQKVMQNETAKQIYKNQERNLFSSCNISFLIDFIYLFLERGEEREKERERNINV